MFVDPASAILLQTGIVPASGEASLTLTVPPIATLTGVEYTWQALIGPPFHLSGKVITLIDAP